MRKSILFSTTALLAMCAIAAYAQDAKGETVVVTGSLENEIPQVLSQSGPQVDTIKGPARKNGGCVDRSQTLSAEAPGRYIASAHGPFDHVEVSLLGSGTQDVLWLADGVHINDRLYAGTPSLDRFPASMVDHIDMA